MISVQKDVDYKKIRTSSVLKIPRWRSIQTVGDEPGMEGNIIYSRNENNFYGHNGATWVPFAPGITTLSSLGGSSLVVDGVGPTLQIRGLTSRDGSITFDTNVSGTLNLTAVGGGGSPPAQTPNLETVLQTEPNAGQTGANDIIFTGGANSVAIGSFGLLSLDDPTPVRVSLNNVTTSVGNLLRIDGQDLLPATTAPFGTGANLFFKAGDNTDNNREGGLVFLSGGGDSAASGSSGGRVALQGGGSVNGSTGGVLLESLAPTDGSQGAGDINVVGGSPTGNGTGASINILAGGTNSGNAGNITLRSGTDSGPGNHGIITLAVGNTAAPTATVTIDDGPTSGVSRIIAPLGTVTDPTFTFVGDIGTGIFHPPALQTLDLVTAGQTALRATPSQTVQVNFSNNTAGVPGYAFVDPTFPGSAAENTGMYFIGNSPDPELHLTASGKSGNVMIINNPTEPDQVQIRMPYGGNANPSYSFSPEEGAGMYFIEGRGSPPAPGDPGELQLSTADKPTATDSIAIKTGNVGALSPTIGGSIRIETGNHFTGNTNSTGEITLKTGDGPQSGNINILAGDSNNADSANVLLTGGQSSSGVGGSVILNSSEGNGPPQNGPVIVRLNDTGTGPGGTDNARLLIDASLGTQISTLQANLPDVTILGSGLQLVAACGTDTAGFVLIRNDSAGSPDYVGPVVMILFQKSYVGTPAIILTSSATSTSSQYVPVYLDSLFTANGFSIICDTNSQGQGLPIGEEFTIHYHVIGVETCSPP